MVWRRYIPRPKGYFTLWELEHQVPARRAGAPTSGCLHAKPLLPPVEVPEPEAMPTPEELRSKARKLFRNESPKRRYHREMREEMFRLNPKRNEYALNEFERADPLGALRSTLEADGRLDVLHLRKYLRCPLRQVLEVLKKEGIPVQIEWRASKGIRVRTITEADAEKVIRAFHLHRGLKLLPKSSSAEP